MRFGALDNAPHEVVLAPETHTAYQQTYYHALGKDKISELIDSYYQAFFTSPSQATDTDYEVETYSYETHIDPEDNHAYLDRRDDQDRGHDSGVLEQPGRVRPVAGRGGGKGLPAAGSQRDGDQVDGRHRRRPCRGPGQPGGRPAAQPRPGHRDRRDRRDRPRGGQYGGHDEAPGQPLRKLKVRAGEHLAALLATTFHLIRSVP